MRVDIGNGIFYSQSFNDNELPRANQAYETIFTDSSRGQFIEASFKFDSEKVLLQFYKDDVLVLDLDVEELESFYDVNNNEFYNMPSVVFYKDKKILFIKFPLPVQYLQKIEVRAKSNDGNKTKKLKGYIAILNKEAEQ